MIKAGVIGHPISHSLSPRLHGYWLDRYKINGEYKAYDVLPDELEQFIRSMPERGFAGCNVTIPYKEKVIGFLDIIDPMAKRIKAVNTIVVKDGKLYGSNTDMTGFAANIAPHVSGTHKAVVLGAGGAAKAVVPALKHLGFQDRIAICNRTDERAQEIARDFEIKSFAWKDYAKELTDADLLVNTTSLGMAGHEPLDIDLSTLPKTALITDIVYKPLITPLLAAARERGNPIVDGLGMLLHQAVPGFEAWFGIKPEVTGELRERMLAP